MAPDWNKLGASFADSSSVLIVDVDCTADGERTCQRMGVRGYPTIKYFMSGDKKGKDYQQGRDFNSLKQFADRALNLSLIHIRRCRRYSLSRSRWSPYH